MESKRISINKRFEELCKENRIAFVDFSIKRQ